MNFPKLGRSTVASGCRSTAPRSGAVPNGCLNGCARPVVSSLAQLSERAWLTASPPSQGRSSPDLFVAVARGVVARAGAVQHGSATVITLNSTAQRQPHNRALLGLDLPLMLKLPLGVLGPCDFTRSPSIVQEDTLAPSSALTAQWSQREISPFR